MSIIGCRGLSREVGGADVWLVAVLLGCVDGIFVWRCDLNLEIYPPQLQAA